MLDQVLSLDDKNAKAVSRKIHCLMNLGHFEQAEKLIRYTSNTIDTFNTNSPGDIQLLRKTLNEQRKALADKKVEEKSFM